MQRGRAQAAHEPQPRRRIGHRLQEDEVLDHRKAGADGKAQHGGIDQEADTLEPQQRHDEAAFITSSATGAT